MAEMTADPRGDVTRSISGWEIFSSVKQGMILLKVHKNEHFFGSDFEFSIIFHCTCKLCLNIKVWYEYLGPFKYPKFWPHKSEGTR